MLLSFFYETQNIVKRMVAKVPALSPNKGILLVPKENAFVPDTCG